MNRNDLETYLADLLQVARYRDYCPNGLQVEGHSEIQTLVTGVSASVALIEAAVRAGAQAILVHHGYFWRAEDPRVVGMKRERLARLLRHDINLFAYHLPLDAHPELGNNAQLARRLGFVTEARFADQEIACLGHVAGPAVRLEELGARIGERLGRPPLVIGEPARPIARVAWCTGAAQDLVQGAARLGADVYITGEVSERTVLEARECGIGFIAAGHHATERYGVQALGDHLAERFGLRHLYVEIDNPA
ncbi:MAG: Nif3-like dinuclear metal center hexameric protein [Azospira oryzae]|nr:MAG: Nif3-like dinuclear metal center hexameric protein [Azospira oryzae]PZP82838.1 MAG: Nif3-like dinuclear metal center hexameric protein [Azospira oryzae]